MTPDEIWPDPIVVDPGHAPLQGPWPKMRRPTAPCAWCQQDITTPSWCETPHGEYYHQKCEHLASEAGRFRRLPGEKKSLQPRITTKAHPNDKRKKTHVSR